MRRGFTLIEIMVSLMIFSIVSMAMIGIMLIGSELYRGGEASRIANDEAVTVIAALDDDLARMVPRAAGGWIFCALNDGPFPITPTTGNTALAFKIEARDPTLVRADGRRRQLMVVWWVDRTPAGVTRLLRGEREAAEDDADPATDQDFATADAVMLGVAGTTTTVVTTGCLHFSASFSHRSLPRARVGDWVDDALPPMAAQPYNTALPTQEYPSAIRLSLVLTGASRFASRGHLITAIGPDDTALRLGGVKGISSLPGSMLRIDDEWICYSSANDGRIRIDADSARPWIRRGARRSIAAPHVAGAPVLFAPSYTLVRSLPE